MKIITDSATLQSTCESFGVHPYVTVDTEFIRETTYWPNLCLIQMACDGQEVIIDPLADGMDLTAFYDLMKKPDVIKVFHAARQDIEIVYHQAGIIPAPLFDTQVAAMVCGFGDSVGYENLVRQLVDARVDKSSRFTDWKRRPLSDKQLTYALSDVTHLRDAYKMLKAQLEASGRAEWLAEEMAVLESPQTYDPDPEYAWKKVKFRGRNKAAFAVFVEVAKWREIQAQRENVPRRRVLRDDALSELALHAPADKDALARLRAVPRGFERSRFADSLIEAIATGKKRDPEGLPDQEPRKPNAPKANGLVEMLKVALRIASERHNVAQKLIANVPDLEKIALDDNAQVPALSGWRRELFGADALAIKQGGLCLVVVDGKVELQPSAAVSPD